MVRISGDPGPRPLVLGQKPTKKDLPAKSPTKIKGGGINLSNDNITLVRSRLPSP